MTQSLKGEKEVSGCKSDSKCKGPEEETNLEYSRTDRRPVGLHRGQGRETGRSARPDNRFLKATIRILDFILVTTRSFWLRF